MTTLDTLFAALQARRGNSYYDQWDAFMSALTDAVVDVGLGLVATSTTSASIGTGSKSLTVQAEKNFAAGQYITASQTSAPANFMVGLVTAYNQETGVLAFTVAAGDTDGSGTITDWTVTVSGRRGATGASGGISGGTLTADIDGDATYSLINLPAPSADGDAARKSYVDSAAEADSLYAIARAVAAS